MPLVTDGMCDETPAHANAGRQCEGQLWSSLNDLCHLLKMENTAAAAQDEVLFQHLSFKTGQHIYNIGEQFEKLYIVRLGFLKTVLIDTNGDEQVLSFPMKGDVLGIDGLHSKAYASEAVALSDGELIIVPYKTLRNIVARYSCFENAIYNIMSRELLREQAMVGMLSALSAEAKVARFLVSMGERFEQIGYSRRAFNLRMARREIGSYLGLTLETVSRTLSLFAEIGYIKVDGRTVFINDEGTLQRLRRVPVGMSKRVRRPSPSDVIARPRAHLITS